MRDHFTCTTFYTAINPMCENGDVRLADGGIDNQGRVEICINNRWGTICSTTNFGTTWDNRDAAVVCRKLGFDLKTTSKTPKILLLCS